MEALSLLRQGMEACSKLATQALGDRGKYVGLSDIGKAAECLRSAVAGKLSVTATSSGQSLSTQQNCQTLLRELRKQRGHWFEDGVAQAFALTGRPVLHQLSIHTRQNNVPIIAHLDFALISGSDAPGIQVVELKSCERIPDTAYTGHEVQLAGQIGLLETLWNQPRFMVQPGPLRTFPDLARHICDIHLPEQTENVLIEGAILMLSMNEAKVFGPYKPNKIMLEVCFNLAEQIWENAEKIRSGAASLNDAPTARGRHPLCDSCEWNADCPRFAGMSAPEFEQDLLELRGLKDEKEAAVLRVQELEERLKNIFQGIGSGREWVNALTQRFRVGLCEGRKTLDKELLRAALTTCLSGDEAEAVLAAGYKTGEPYERLYVSPINNG